MREISLNRKIRVIKLFLGASTYRGIREQEGVSEGSVVSIINDFREGKIPLPPDMTEYIDELRHLVVDLKKSQTSVNQLKGYIKINNKLHEMGVDVERIEDWLDTCQEIAASYASDGQFIEIFSELAQLSSETGMTYRELLDDYKIKMGMSEKLGRKLEQAREELKKTELENREGIKTAKEDLDLIRKEIVNSKKYLFEKERKLKLQLEAFLKQNRLSWDKVNTVYSLTKGKLGSGGMKAKDIDELLKEISLVGSLAVVIKQMQSKVDKLSQKEKSLTSDIKKLEKIDNDLQTSIWDKQQEKKMLSLILEAQNETRDQFEKEISDYRDDISVVQAIIKVLASPNTLLTRDFDRLVFLIATLREKRYAISCYFNKFGSHVDYDSLSTPISLLIEAYLVDLDETRQRLALYLIPIVKDKFTPTVVYNTTQAVKSILDFRANL